MSHRSSRCARTLATCGALLTLFAQGATLRGHQDDRGETPTGDPVVARVFEHVRDGRPPIVLVVDSRHFPPAVWTRVKDLVAFRLHRPQPDGTTVADAATYLVRDSDLYRKAAAALRNRTTNHEYVWCLLAAVLAHESAHAAPLTERQALTAEAAQVRRCLFAGHMNSGSDWSPLGYLNAVEAKLRRPREHY